MTVIATMRRAAILGSTGDYYLVGNAGNGGNGRRRLIDQAREIFASGGIQAELAETTGPGHATEIAQPVKRGRVGDRDRCGLDE